MNVTYEHPTTPTQQKRKQLLHCWTRSAGLASEACWEHSSILLQATQSPTWWRRPDLHSTTGKLFENRKVSSVQGKKKITAIFTWFQMVAKHAFHVQFLGNVSYWEWLQMRRDGPQHRLEWRSRLPLRISAVWQTRWSTSYRIFTLILYTSNKSTLHCSMKWFHFHIIEKTPSGKVTQCTVKENVYDATVFVIIAFGTVFITQLPAPVPPFWYPGCFPLIVTLHDADFLVCGSVRWRGFSSGFYKNGGRNSSSLLSKLSQYLGYWSNKH